MLSKNFKTVVALIIAITSLLNVSANDVDLSEKDYEPILRIYMDNKETIESRTISELYYSTDIEGNLYGAEDFTVDGSTIYVLNSSNNTVLKYKDQLLADTIDVDAFGITAILISADNGGLYILGTDLSVVKISDEGTVTSRNYAEFIGDEAITDFIVDEGKMYISTPEGDYDTTYVFDSSSYAAEDAIDIFDGRYFDKGIIYTVDKVGENKSFSNICIVTVFNGDFVDKYTLTSDYLITGAVFLGYDENKNALIKVIEACSDENYKIVSSETIRTISESGDVIMISEVPNQYKSIINPTKVIDGELYHLSSYSNAVELTDMNIMKSVEAVEYKSSLDSVKLPVYIGQGISFTGSKITRAEIMEIAASYHSSYSWTCTSANLSALENWIKPRYIGGAGTYKCMPYCWGGFNNQSEFEEGLANGGRVGNINAIGSNQLSNTYGLDCSGYVSRCWNLSEKRGTGNISEDSYNIELKNIKQGDAFNNPGSHIMLFDEINSSGNYIMYECTQLNDYDKVAHTIRNKSGVENDYTPIRYDNVSD